MCPTAKACGGYSHCLDHAKQVVPKHARPVDLYRKPDNPFVAGFLGVSTFVSGKAEEGGLRAGGLDDGCVACLVAGCDLVLVCLPEVVVRLLGATAPAALCEGSAAAPKLHGRPTVDGDELVRVAEEGIREWAHWQRSLEELNGQGWA